MRVLFVFLLSCLLAAGLVAAAPAAAAPGAASAPTRGATMFVHSANSGEIRGDRLTLRGVGHTVTWTTSGGRSGVVLMVSPPSRVLRAQGHAAPASIAQCLLTGT
jgi:hypothetical protein